MVAAVLVVEQEEVVAVQVASQVTGAVAVEGPVRTVALEVVEVAAVHQSFYSTVQRLLSQQVVAVEEAVHIEAGAVHGRVLILLMVLLEQAESVEAQAVVNTTTEQVVVGEAVELQVELVDQR